MIKFSLAKPNTDHALKIKKIYDNGYNTAAGQRLRGLTREEVTAFIESRDTTNENEIAFCNGARQALNDFDALQSP